MPPESRSYLAPCLHLQFFVLLLEAQEMSHRNQSVWMNSVPLCSHALLALDLGCLGGWVGCKLEAGSIPAFVLLSSLGGVAPHTSTSV